MRNLSGYISLRYFIPIAILSIFVNLKLLFFFLVIIFLKIYFKVKKIFFLIVSYIFFGFLLIDILAPKITTKESIYFIESDLEYSINNEFGYHPKKNKVFIEKTFRNNELFKENKYTINSFGHRVQFNKKDNNSCLLFYGGSVTFGQSVNDDETLSYYTNRNLKYKHSVYNFAFNGYGPHQFLSKIENNYLEELNKCENVQVIYLYIDDHIGRTAGKRSWGDKSPRYVLINKDIMQKGFFSDYPFKIIMKLRKNFRNSFVISKIYNLDSVNQKDEELFIKIINKIENNISQKFEKVNFVYLLWDLNNSRNENIYRFFENKKIIEINLLNINENYKKNGIEGDNHPTKEFYEHLSFEVAKYIRNYNK
jgi:hypothetical protein